MSDRTNIVGKCLRNRLLSKGQIFVWKWPDKNPFRLRFDKKRGFENEMMQNKSPTVVWWDMDTIPPPERLDPCQIRQSIESVFSHYLPFTIFAHGNLDLIPRCLLEQMLSSGIVLKHGLEDTIPVLMDLEKWIDNDPPPATFILISDREDLCEKLPALMKYGYTVFRVGKTNKPGEPAKYPPSVVTVPWDHILSVCDGFTTREVSDKCTTAWQCKVCIDSSLPFVGEGYESFDRHFKSVHHADQVSLYMPQDYSAYVEKTGKTRKTGVWWDMDACPPLDELYPYQVRRSIESMFSDGLPLNMSAIGNLNSIDAGVWESILSAGFFTKHLLGGPEDMTDDIQRWVYNSPSPATLVLISDHEQSFHTTGYLLFLKDMGYTIICVYPECPDVSPEYTSLTYSRTYALGDVLSGVLNQEVDKVILNQEVENVKDKCSETAWFCNICIEFGHTFAGESYESLTRHMSSAEHSIQELKQVPPKIKASQSKKPITKTAMQSKIAKICKMKAQSKRRRRGNTCSLGLDILT
ncbi:unnamed protein product [Microthlaspi erraticum]|uniref:NYN domain-containing protein n=1 Tax=Microthlaspi erraticum TaxID=1685480 RepID=A0A6D2IH43_9BRAS|nr:unnamed protein product [Microthlaspi erraticum]